jgi:hypothetical protein
MGILGFVKDIVLLPVDVALDVTMIRPLGRALNDDDNHDTPFGTIDRIQSIAKNLDETVNK